MSHYIDGWCGRHGEYSVDSDFPSGCPQCEALRQATITAARRWVERTAETVNETALDAALRAAVRAMDAP